MISAGGKTLPSSWILKKKSFKGRCRPENLFILLSEVSLGDSVAEKTLSRNFPVFSSYLTDNLLNRLFLHRTLQLSAVLVVIS